MNGWVWGGLATLILALQTTAAVADAPVARPAPPAVRIETPLTPSATPGRAKSFKDRHRPDGPRSANPRPPRSSSSTAAVPSTDRTTADLPAGPSGITPLNGPERRWQWSKSTDGSPFLDGESDPRPRRRHGEKAVGDKPAAVATLPAADRPPTADASARPAAIAATSTEAASPSPTVVPPTPPIPAPRIGAPSASMHGLTVRDLVVNQIVVAVPVNNGADIANDYGLSVNDDTTIRSLGVRLVSFTVLRPRGLGDLIDQLGLDPRIQSAQPNFRYRTSSMPTPSAYPLGRMKIEPALSLANGSGVTVALIDTRVADISSLVGHVAERIVIGSGKGQGRHGTALAGLIADVAPAARLLAIEAFADDPSDPETGVATTLTLARAIDMAIDRKADIINLSVAGPRDPLIGRLVRQALSRGTVVVAAAGNDGPDSPPRYPAAYDGVVAVTATDANDQLYPAAAQGTHIAIAAPGVDIRATVSEGVVGYVTGTSVAAAQVTGIAALLRERAPKLGSAEVGRLLKETSTPLPKGPGMVDAFAALSRTATIARR